jgi:pimeloyl-ACP methyl ester carboxylesterase
MAKSNQDKASSTDKQQTGYTQVNGARLYYEIAGTGKALVLIHAGITDRRMWDDQFHSFAQHYQVIRYDMRGYGNSTMGAGEHSHSENLHGLLAALGLKPAIVVGVSQGGTIALDFALEHPEMTHSLILISAVPTGYNFEGEPPQKLLHFFFSLPTTRTISSSRVGDSDMVRWSAAPG